MIGDSGRSRQRFVALALTLSAAFATLHLPFLPQSLEDLDSINFALGMRRFDVAHHQPHPPGYPLFILLARICRLMTASEIPALALLSVVAGALGALAVVRLHRLMSAEPRGWSVAAAAIAVTSPLYWVTASRPLSDMTGLAASMAVQAMTLAARTESAFRAAAFCAGLAVGIRSQVFWLTAPLLVWAIVRHPGPAREAYPRAAGAGIAYAAGTLLWLIPLIAMSGGPGAYWQALSNQGSEDLTGIRMLWTTPTSRELADALYYALAAPWAVWPAAALVLAAAAAGAIALSRTDRRRLEILGAAFLPYLFFDILFQETFTSRYALPLVVPIAFLAARGLSMLPLQPALVAVGALVAWDAHVGGRTVAALASEPAPAFRLLADMRRVEGLDATPVLAPDRRESFDLRRPIAWLGDAAPTFDRVLPAPSQREWLQAADYWDAGGRLPVWFVVDPRRAAIDLVQHGRPFAYRWSMPYPVLMSGTRPGDADWYVVARPDWYVREGWALTPEAAGVAAAERKGLGYGPIAGRVRAAALSGGALLVGGRNFEPAARPVLTLTAGRLWSGSISVPAGAFVELLRLPPIEVDASTPDYVEFSIASSPPARVAVEQFDLAGNGTPSRPLLAFGAGWQEQELDPETGRRWRWLSERSELRYIARAPSRLHVEGESPLRYYAGQSRILVRADDKVIRDLNVASDFSFDVDLPASVDPSTLVIETDQTHVPAESRSRPWARSSADRRRLGLRIFKCELRPASVPGTTGSSLPAR